MQFARHVEPSASEFGTVTLEVDAAPDAAPACTMPDYFDTFDDSSAPVCGEWGRLNTSSSTATTWPARMNGTLVIEPVVGVAASASCATKLIMSFGRDGVWFEALGLPASQGFVVLSIETRSTLGGSTNATTKIAGSLAGVGMSDHPSNTQIGVGVPWFPDETRWWRMRPDNDGHTIVGEVSGDFVNWLELGRRDLPEPETASYLFVALGAGRNDTTTNVGKATLDRFNVCP